MKMILLSLGALFPFISFAEAEILTPRLPIPEVLTTRKTRYTQVEVANIYSDRISFVHADGVVTIALTEFDDTNLERLIPGYIARKQKIEAEALARLHYEEQVRKAEEKLRLGLAEAKRKRELEKAEAIRVAELARSTSQTEIKQRDTTRQNSKFNYISSERAEQYFSSDARAEMKKFLRQNGNPNPSQQDIDFALKFNERLEYHSERAKKYPELYQ